LDLVEKIGITEYVLRSCLVAVPESPVLRQLLFTVPAAPCAIAVSLAINRRVDDIEKWGVRC